MCFVFSDHFATLSKTDAEAGLVWSSDDHCGAERRGVVILSVIYMRHGTEFPAAACEALDVTSEVTSACTAQGRKGCVLSNSDLLAIEQNASAACFGANEGELRIFFNCRLGELSPLWRRAVAVAHWVPCEDKRWAFFTSETRLRTEWRSLTRGHEAM